MINLVLFFRTISQVQPPKFNIDPEKGTILRGNNSNHHFSGAMLIFGDVKVITKPPCCLKDSQRHYFLQRRCCQKQKMKVWKHGKRSQRSDEQINVAIFGWVNKHTLTLPPGETWNIFCQSSKNHTTRLLHWNFHNMSMITPTKKKNKCPLNRDHFERPCHLLTINIQEIC